MFCDTTFNSFIYNFLYRLCFANKTVGVLTTIFLWYVFLFHDEYKFQFCFLFNSNSYTYLSDIYIYIFSIPFLIFFTDLLIYLAPSCLKIPKRIWNKFLPTFFFFSPIHFTIILFVLNES